MAVIAVLTFQAGLRQTRFLHRTFDQGRAQVHDAVSDRFQELGTLFRRRFAVAIERLPRQLAGQVQLGLAMPDRHRCQFAHRPIGVGQQTPDAAAPQHEQAPGVVACQMGGRERRGGRRAPGGQLVAVDLGQRLARGGVVEHIGREQPGQAPRRVAGKDVDRLDAQVRALPRRHDEHRAAIHRMHMAGRHLSARHERSGQGGDEPLEGQGGRGGLGVEVLHCPIR